MQNDNSKLQGEGRQLKEDLVEARQQYREAAQEVLGQVLLHPLEDQNTIIFVLNSFKGTHCLKISQNVAVWNWFRFFTRVAHTQNT